ncbi:hypothetical protein MTR67_051495 [Solanum verrucosum]|uniref:Uncharacterized protein n=1 Tax=Solanum verrucosum TaxID=315347 RepID=A0AAF0V583_SOLVR|nr:hypothetical protein MTR67_051495 [Solanum verrucosum]
MLLMNPFIESLMSSDLHMKRYNDVSQLILVFCKLLRRVIGLEDPLYSFCRSCIRDIVEVVGIAMFKKNVANELIALNDVFMFVREDVTADLSRELELSMDQLNLRGYHYKTERCLRKLEDKLRLINEESIDDYRWIIEHKEAKTRAKREGKRQETSIRVNEEGQGPKEWVKAASIGVSTAPPTTPITMTHGQDHESWEG